MGKHNGSFGKQYGKVVGKDADERPGYTGPEKAKKAVAPKKEKMKKAPRIEEERDEIVSEPNVTIEVQQLVLNIFKDTFPTILISETLQPVLQDVKAALYARDFARAFGKEEFLEAYSVRWSPSRALCYLSILVELQKEFPREFLRPGSLSLPQDPQVSEAPTSSESECPKTVCFGGGAAEVVAFGGYLRNVHGASAPPQEPIDVAEAMSALAIARKTTEMDVLLIDTAQWGNVIQKLEAGLTAVPSVPKYANAKARAAVSPLLLSGKLVSTFQQEDVLALSQVQLAKIVENRKLVTLLFTLNELYTASMTKTTNFLLDLTLTSKPGTLLLVVDSPGSYSEIVVGSESKKYPMHLLLDHTLLGSRKPTDQPSAVTWVKMVSKEAQWFRLATELQYPIPLENMRYQIHLYRRV